MALISSIGEVNLDALDKSIADTAVDIFVYDTRKDSDGGKWRKRTKKTSWYNETLNTTTRGSRREFPAVAVIVAEASKVTIYDGDDPDLPMWMVFTKGIDSNVHWIAGDLVAPVSSSTITAINGTISSGISDSGTGRLTWCNFISDEGYNIVHVGKWKFIGGIGTRNDGLGWYQVSSTLKLINRSVNDIAMTVLPNAPIDPATGLPTPTIAVATNGGVSVIKDDGTVVDAVGTTFDVVNSISFDKNNRIICSSGSAGTDQAFFSTFAIPSADLSNVFPGGDNGYYRDTYSSTDLPWYRSTGSASNHSINEVSSYGDYISFGTEDDGSTLNPGLKIISENISNPSEGMLCGVSTSYNTGWMHGDIKGAFLSDTDATNVTGGALITGEDSNFNGGTIGNWVVGQNSGTALLTNSSNRLALNTNSSSYPTATLNVGTQQPGLYTLAGEFYMSSAAVQIIYDTGGIVNTSVLNETINTWHYFQRTFEMTTSFDSIGFRMNVIGGGHVAQFDNLTFSKADPDRSVNNKGLQVFGTITKSPVATGSDLVAYSGWSGTNYLEQPYNSDLNFGTGDFSVMFWTKIVPVTGAYKLFQIDYSAGMFNFFVDGLGTAVTIVGNKMYQDKSTNNTGWSYHVILRKNGMFMYYSNGNFIKQATSTENLSTFTSLKIGYLYLNLPISLFRISASAPTAEQIKKIYEDEKVLFQENAKCTLYGSSDAVTALAYDDKTNLLHVGTSSGRSDFKGLRRINNTTTGITTAISASNRLIAEQ